MHFGENWRSGKGKEERSKIASLLAAPLAYKVPFTGVNVTEALHPAKEVGCQGTALHLRKLDGSQIQNTLFRWTP